MHEIAIVLIIVVAVVITRMIWTAGWPHPSQPPDYGDYRGDPAGDDDCASMDDKDEERPR